MIYHKRQKPAVVNRYFKHEIQVIKHNNASDKSVSV